MGIYSEYLSKNLTYQQLTDERKKWLKKISELRSNRNIFVYASAVTKRGDVAIDESDLIPFTDTVSSLDTTKGIDIILQTPGGSAETVEKMVRYLRGRFNHMAVIVPGMAMSAGTIFTMAANEILMGEISSLGPIDAQIPFNGRFLPAATIIDGVKEIKEDVIKNNGKLNPAYIPILQNINPGVLKDCETAQSFSTTLVKPWLKIYKFSDWAVHEKSENKDEVTEKDKEKRAEEIANALCSHSRWLTHARSLGIKELTELKLKIIDYSKNQELNEAISRYFILLSMTFDITSIYKIFETPTSQVLKQVIQNTQSPLPNEMFQQKKHQDLAQVQFICPKCKHEINLQANLRPGIPLMKGFIYFPKDNKIVCPNCKLETDLSMFRMQLEAQSGAKIL